MKIKYYHIKLRLQRCVDNFRMNHKKMLDEAASESRIKIELLEFEMNKLNLDLDYANDKNVEVLYKLVSFFLTCK